MRVRAFLARLAFDGFAVLDRELQYKMRSMKADGPDFRGRGRSGEP